MLIVTAYTFITDNQYNSHILQDAHSEISVWKVKLGIRSEITNHIRTGIGNWNMHFVTRLPYILQDANPESV